jgi:hypothetical protein
MEAYENAKLVTVCLQIGNSDDKLSQPQWAAYVFRVGEHVGNYARERHFFGGSETYARWQNVCWVFVMEEQRLDALRRHLQLTREFYQQDSIAILVGDTAFI